MLFVDDLHCRFTVRVMVPCYAEPLSVVSATVTAAMEADLPPGEAVTLDVQSVNVNLELVSFHAAAIHTVLIPAGRAA